MPDPGTPGPSPTGGTPEPQAPFPGPPNREGSPAAEGTGPVVHTPPTATRPGPEGLAVTRSEEELRVGVRTRLRRLRVRKYLVTDYVTRTIPVRREEVRLEEVGPDQVVAGGAGDWDPAGDQAAAPELEVVLYREEPVIQLRPVPVERVRLVKRLVTEERTITEELRKEHVELDEHPRP